MDASSLVGGLSLACSSSSDSWLSPSVLGYYGVLSVCSPSILKLIFFSANPCSSTTFLNGLDVALFSAAFAIYLNPLNPAGGFH